MPSAARRSSSACDAGKAAQKCRHAARRGPSRATAGRASRDAASDRRAGSTTRLGPCTSSAWARDGGIGHGQAVGQAIAIARAGAAARLGLEPAVGSRASSARAPAARARPRRSCCAGAHRRKRVRSAPRSGRAERQSRAKPLTSRFLVEAQRQHDAARRDRRSPRRRGRARRASGSALSSSSRAGRPRRRQAEGVILRRSALKQARQDRHLAVAVACAARRSTSVRSCGLFQASWRDRLARARRTRRCRCRPGAGSSLAVQEAWRSAAPDGGGAAR